MAAHLDTKAITKGSAVAFVQCFLPSEYHSGRPVTMPTLNMSHLYSFVRRAVTSFTNLLNVEDGA